MYCIAQHFFLPLNYRQVAIGTNILPNTCRKKYLTLSMYVKCLHIFLLAYLFDQRQTKTSLCIRFIHLRILHTKEQVQKMERGRETKRADILPLPSIGDCKLGAYIQIATLSWLKTFTDTFNVTFARHLLFMYANAVCKVVRCTTSCGYVPANRLK